VGLEAGVESGARRLGPMIGVLRQPPEMMMRVDDAHAATNLSLMYSLRLDGLALRDARCARPSGGRADSAQIPPHPEECARRASRRRCGPETARGPARAVRHARAPADARSSRERRRD